MPKVAKLVTVSFTTRVVVDTDLAENLQEVELTTLAQEAIDYKVWDEFSENIDSVMDDTVCPYGTFDWEK